MILQDPNWESIILFPMRVWGKRCEGRREGDISKVPLAEKADVGHAI